MINYILMIAEQISTMDIIKPLIIVIPVFCVIALFIIIIQKVFTRK